MDGLVDGSSDVELETTVIKDLPGSARPGTKLGEVVVKVDGERVGESPLVVRRGYERGLAVGASMVYSRGIFA